MHSVEKGNAHGSLKEIMSAPWKWSLLILLFANLCNTVSSIGWNPLSIPMRAALHLTTAQVGAIVGIGGIATVVVAIPGGWLVTKFGSKKMLVVNFILAAAGMLVLSAAKDYNGALIGRAVWQFFYRMAVIATVAATTMAVPANFRGRAMGLNATFGNIGSLIGAPLGATIAAATSWNNAFVVYACFMVIGCIGIPFLFKEYKEEKPVQIEVPKAEAKKETSPFLIPMVWGLAVLMFFFSVGGAVAQYIPLQLKDTYKQTAVVAALIQSVSYGIGIFCNPLIGWFSDKFGRWNGVYFCGGVSIVLYLAMLIPNFYVFCFCSFFIPFLGIMTINTIYTAGADLLKGRAIGSITGVTVMGLGASMFVINNLLGILKDMTGGYVAGQITVAGFILIGCVVAFILGKAAKKREAAENA